MDKQFALLMPLDNLILDNSNRKTATYTEIGWDETNTLAYVSKKENIMKIASFNTTTVNFTASSRRNRYYDIYNRLDMLEHDILLPKCSEVIKLLTKDFKIFVVSLRTKDLEEKTLSALKNLGFPVESVEFSFKKMHEPIASYKKKCLIHIHNEFSSGIGLILHPDDSILLNEYDYSPVGFSSIKNKEDFSTEVVCANWSEISSSISQS